ncbi:hypothetical protein SAMN04515667_0955 [Formosa sp. Hel1_31_208]|uniref:Eco57I restriction-modification methylase domain-containing protein n=1 Tax=Formosa sp. Hel1_31_208 TaxID=1798225 RepID=UPI000879A2A6|nr:hypothetical protein [Formosa sp. Hel1_31_208]SDR90495.1 hypothetical protein SAMN04515667_0955 [Formosa sp. Hel1_31_208]
MALAFIKSSGNIISEEFCEDLLKDVRSSYVKDDSFDLKKVDDYIAIAYEDLKKRWEEIREDILNDAFDNTTLRKKWIIPFLKALGFDPQFIASNIRSDADQDYHIPYKGWNENTAPKILILNSSLEFDKKNPESRTHPRKSPQDMLQQYLNTADDQWGIITNGKKIRVLRDFYHSITKGYLEFDLEGIFESGNTQQFRILFKILHHTRFLNQDEKSEQECILETFHKESKKIGLKVGDDLRNQVIVAIESFGNGFAENINPDEVSDEDVKYLYTEILNVIYRLLFLLFAEQKGWLPSQNSIYTDTYSIDTLRKKVLEGNYSYDEHSDLWEGLKITFNLVGNGYEFPDGSKINAFGGQLFKSEKIIQIASFNLKNKYLLKAIDALCFFVKDKIRQRINYATLAIDELGSVYESLLDYNPRILKEDLIRKDKLIGKRGQYIMDDQSMDRKTTGSYYTDSRLVSQLIESALIPVIEDTIRTKDSEEDKEKAILSLKVADIACGSGAFILAALNKLAEYLATIRKGDEDLPSELQLREAKRDVLMNCIYGVDLNPMAVELCKFSLWITAAMPGMPLTFLDHKIKCGNSLIGATPELIKKGIPVEAFNPVTLDDKDVCTDLKKKVREELKQIEKGSLQRSLDFKVTVDESLDDEYFFLNEHDQDSVEDIAELEQEYFELRQKYQESIEWRLADAWTASFFFKKDSLQKKYPTNETLNAIKNGEEIDENLEKEIAQLSSKYNFFHFHLEFPEVANQKGFDCLLGNPPWERVKLQEKEFFKGKDDTISNTSNKSQRIKLINGLKESNIKLFNQFIASLASTEHCLNFYHNSNKYPILGRGDVNTYMLFTEVVFRKINRFGLTGIIVPTNIATDDNTKHFFQFIIENQFLKSLFDFENKEKLFSEVHAEQRFSLLTLTGDKYDNDVMLAFFIHNTDQLKGNRVYTLSAKDFFVFNPNTKNCPTFRTKKEAELGLKIYSNKSIWINEENNEFVFNSKPWGMVHMTNMAHLFIDLNDDKIAGAVPLYEGKYTDIYNHRYTTFESVDDLDLVNGNPRSSTIEELKNINFEITPRYYIKTDEYKSIINGKINRNYWVSFHGITNPNNERTLITNINPGVPFGNSAPVILFETEDDKKYARLCCLLTANLNCFVLDYIVRQKMGGRNLNFYIIKQLPLIDDYSDKNLEDTIIDIVSELSCTSESLANLSLDLYGVKKVFIWDEERRLQLMCKLNAIYFKLYNLSESDIEFIMDQFPLVKRRNIEKYGGYKTLDLIIENFKELI